MKHIVIDLEMNMIPKNTPARGICTMETIEIGAVMLDDDLQEISSFRTYVKSEYNPVIERNITKLTGITTDMVRNAPTFAEALRMFTTWCLGTEDDVTVYAWSDNDFSQITKEIRLKHYQIRPDEALLLTREWSDFQHEFDTYLGFERQLSLTFALSMAGIDFMGHKHDALDDARNTAGLLQIFRNPALFDLTLAKIKEAMEPTDIGISLGELFDFSAFAFE